MSYQVIARKWRPKSFEELVGQAHVTQTLLNALRSGRLPQAILLSGARGVGKTSSARIFAKSLRCTDSKDFVPCSVCQTCIEIAAGHNLDVIEIDGASNNGVDAIRELRDTVGYMPASGKYKVYIIDEVHMLSTSAFNALLKTLEEPPPHVVFIFATTEPQKIPVTILSRCQRFDFRRIPTRQIAERLELICREEGLEAEPEALWAIARQAEGALRDSQSLLDQAITYCNGKITLEKVNEILGLTDHRLLVDCLDALTTRSSSKAISVIDRLYSSGFDASVFVQDLLELLRHMVIIKVDPESSKSLVDLAESERDNLARLVADLSPEDVHLLFDMTLKGANDLIRAQNPRVVLEMLLLRMSSAPRIVELSKLLNSAPQPQLAKAAAAPRPTKAATQEPTASAPQPLAQPLTTQPEPVAASQKQNSYQTQLSPQENWIALVKRIKTNLPLLGAKLEYAALLELTAQKLRLAVKDQLIHLQLNEAATRAKIENFVKTFWNQSVTVDLEVAKGDSAPPSPKELDNLKEKNDQEELLKEVENHPMVKKTQSVFETKISAIKEKP